MLIKYINTFKLANMYDKNNIANTIITHCAACHELMLDTDDLLIPISGGSWQQGEIICKACYEKGCVIANTTYSKCLFLQDAYCPNCNEFNIIFVASLQRKIVCIYCDHAINIESYVAAAIKQK